MISVIIPTHNAAGSITACIQALQCQDIEAAYEIIVVDRGSSDETVRLAQEAGVTVIQQEQMGEAAARNSGIQAAGGELVCFTDAGCIATPDWLAQITAPFAHPEVIGSKGIYATRQKKIVARFVQIEYEEKFDRLRSQSHIDFIDTYSAAYRRDVLLANNGFDERFPYMEAQELSFRLSARGYRMVFQPTAVVYTDHTDSPTAYFRRKFMIGYWKSQVVRRFPGQGVSDSHTPQVMKIQMLLVMALVIATAVYLVGLTTIRPVSLLLLAFISTTIPFVAKAWSKDHTVALIAPFLLALRAMALSLGYLWGTARPQPGISGQEATIGGLNYIGKRGLDIVGGLIGLLFTFLVTPFIVLAIKIDSPGPVLFRQERVGQSGRPFTIYKFRSMSANAEAELDQLLDLNQLPEPVFKLNDDPRISAVGRILRRWSLDELPQFWNVLKGEMSLIGPRPEEVRIVARYNDWHRRRLSIKPGLTGPMQVNGRGDLPLDARVRLDLEYIENYSFKHDIAILLKTVPAVIRGKGAR